MKLILERWNQYLFEQNIDEESYIGFHCQKYQHKGDYQGSINREYGETWMPQIVDALNFDIQDELMDILKDKFDRDIRDFPSKWDDDFEDWSEEVEYFLEDKGIHWIFVSEERPLENFGTFCYKVYLPEREVMTVLPDFGVEGTASVYIYDSNKIKPILIPYQA